MNQLIKRILGIDRYVLSPQRYKRVKLTSQVAFMFVCAMVIYTTLDFIQGYDWPQLIDLAGVALGITALVLNRNGHFQTAKILLMITINGLALFFSYILVRDLGVFIFSICINIGTLAAYGYENIKTALTLSIVSTLAFLFVMFHQHERMPVPAAPNYIEINLLVDFLMASIASTVIVFYFLKANHKAETELILKEKAIRDKNKELITINSELDKFFYSVSHDLRAPLTSVQGLIQLMEISDNLPEMKEYATMLKGRAKNLEQFISQISDYAGNSRQPVKAVSLSLKNVIRENLENFRFYPKADKIRIVMEIPEDVWLVSDPVRLQVVFGNLLSNAIKYHDLNKAAPFISISVKENGQHLEVMIEDNGSGIKEESLNKIFGMFYRAHRQAEGSGLGLYIVKDALEKIQGDIQVKSTYGQGSSFIVTLPREIKASASEEVGPPSE